MTVDESTSRSSSRTSGVAAGPFPPDRIRVGLIGCGGRGSGAAVDAVEAAPNVEIYAMGDLFRDRLETSAEQLQKHAGDAFNVSEDRRFSGFDAYEHVLETEVDYVILATPPHYRPEQLQAAVDAGKHVFFEKPVAVDPPGVKQVIEAGKTAEKKGLSLVAGTMYRRQDSFIEGVTRVHDGVIGEPVSAQAFYLTGPIWLRERKSGMSDMEWQCRNWYYFTWLSGDHIVEQFVHNLDTMNWIFQGHPVKASATGGRQVRIDPSYGHIYDHFAVVYTYPNGVTVRAMCRQMEKTKHDVSNRVVGSEATADINPRKTTITSHDGETLFEMEKGEADPYVVEHTDLIESIRQGEPLNEAEEVAHSTMTAILGREAAYTGQELTWEEVMAADDLSLGPESYKFGPATTPPIPQPGQTTLQRTL